MTRLLPHSIRRRATAAVAARYAGLTWLIQRMPRRASVITLMYHRICDVLQVSGDPHLVSASPEIFAQQLDSLKRVGPVVSLDEALAHLEGGGRGSVVLITFDDGYLDNYRHAWPLLRAAGLPATFFLTTSFVGSSAWPWWDRIAYAVRNTSHDTIAVGGETLLLGSSLASRLRATRALQRRYERLSGCATEVLIREIEDRCGCAAQPTHRRFLDWDEAREMQAGGMTIGAHTLTHPLLARLPAAEQYRELAESRRLLQERLGAPIDAVAYPVGHRETFGEPAVAAARAAGYRAAFRSEVDGFNSPPVHDWFRLARIAVDHLTPDLLELRVGLIAATGGLRL